MNDTNKTRTIHTGLYGDYAKEILNAVSGQLSDGLWENSRGYDKYWTNFNVVVEVDGEITFHVNTDYNTRYCNCFLENPFRGMSDEEFKQWYAGKLKAVIMQELRDNNIKKGWNRRNMDFKSHYLNYRLDVNVADIYCVYDQLLGRQIGVTRYDTSTMRRALGQKADDTTIAKCAELAEAKAKALADYKEHVAMLDEKVKKFMAEINADKQQAYKVYYTVLENLEKKYEIV